MPTIKKNLQQLNRTDSEFAGTVALRNEKLSLPDGSKVAIGIDRQFWVIVYQATPGAPFIIYEFNAEKNTLLVDKVQGGEEDYRKVRKIINYFFENAQVDDVVTYESTEVPA